MIISLNWLKNYVDLEGIDDDTIIESLTTCGLEVEEVSDMKKAFENIVVGYVEECVKHPNADKLSLCKVNDGKEIFSVVCGAPNVESGQKVAFAKIGAVIPNGQFKISKTKIRGEISQGMICAEDELGLSDDHSGIMTLRDAAKLGDNLAVELGIDDVILDIAVTPNRADALSHWGTARDLAAIFRRKTKFPDVSCDEKGGNAADFAEIEIRNQFGCPRYVGKVVRNVEIKESPLWLQKRLISIGLRPINNVVDVTNFVLHELGQPLHAFDLDKLAGNKIIVRSADEGEKFITLDSKERELKDTDLMICDAQKPVAIAGVMGGENSEVTSETKNILIESAFFNPSSIRKTAKLLGLSTDASYRFERGCNPDMTIPACRRAAKLIAELGGGDIAVGEIDVYPEPLENKIINLRFSRITRILGYSIEPDAVINILNSLELKVSDRTDNGITVSVPPFRHDIEREIDLIEEVARIYGYDKIPAVERIANNLDAKVDERGFLREIKKTLSGLGFYEIITNSLLNEETAQKFGNAISVLNPQSKDMSHLRPSLLPGLLAAISRNIKVKESNLKLYEIGHIFEKINNNIDDFSDFIESEHLAFAVTGDAVVNSWYVRKNIPFDFFDLKGFADELLRNLSLGASVKDSYKVEENNLFEYYYKKVIGKNTAAVGGKVSKNILSYFDIKEDVFVFDFSIDELKKVRAEKKTFSELLKYPKITKDFAFIFEKNVSFKNITAIIKKNSSNLLKNIHLFDIFESNSLGKDKKSLAFQLEFYDEKRTLTEEEVEKDFWNIIEAVKKEFNAELRG